MKDYKDHDCQDTKSFGSDICHGHNNCIDVTLSVFNVISSICLQFYLWWNIQPRCRIACPRKALELSEFCAQRLYHLQMPRTTWAVTLELRYGNHHSFSLVCDYKATFLQTSQRRKVAHVVAYHPCSPHKIANRTNFSSFFQPYFWALWKNGNSGTAHCEQGVAIVYFQSRLSCFILPVCRNLLFYFKKLLKVEKGSQIG